MGNYYDLDKAVTSRLRLRQRIMELPSVVADEGCF